MVPIPTFPTVESVPAFESHPSVAIATIFCNPEASPTNLVAVIIPLVASSVIPAPMVTTFVTLTVDKLDIFAL